MRELFACANVAPRHERNLSAYTKIWITRMIRIQHRQLPLFVCDRRDEQILVDLNFHRTKSWRDFFAQGFSINDVAAFDRHDFVFGNAIRGEETAAVDSA